MFNADGMELSISRGDSGILKFAFTPVLASGNTLIFSVSRFPGRGLLLEKSITTTGAAQEVFNLSGDDTDIEPGDYFWDLRLNSAGTIATPVLPNPFIILPVVGDGEV